PHVVGRPLSLVRCPAGVAGQCFYQKHVVGRFPKGVRLVDVGEGADKLYPVVVDATGLLALAQISTIELHPWGSTVRNLDRPDRLIFDLDPGPGVAWPRMIAAAKVLRRRLAEADLDCFVKTTGGKGLHVTVPVRPELDWATAKQFCRAVATALAREAPETFVATSAKAKRAGHIYIDYLRNARGATAVAPYSLRAREPAPIAMPISWSKLDRIDSAAFATLGNAEKFLSGPDPWRGIENCTQRLTKSMLKRISDQL
ncbi:MAG: non-homologous end-joining DNA ligase, partial [Alphaproteobacteria bacterium]